MAASSKKNGRAVAESSKEGDIEQQRWIAEKVAGQVATMNAGESSGRE